MMKYQNGNIWKRRRRNRRRRNRRRRDEKKQNPMSRKDKQQGVCP